jgi:hypothetical protein
MLQYLSQNLRVSAVVNSNAVGVWYIRIVEGKIKWYFYRCQDPPPGSDRYGVVDEKGLWERECEFPVPFTPIALYTFESLCTTYVYILADNRDEYLYSCWNYRMNLEHHYMYMNNATFTRYVIDQTLADTQLW